MPVTVRNFDQLVDEARALLRITQPELDTKIGTVSRDLFIDAPLDQLAQFYTALLRVSRMQALDTATGIDLDRLAANFGVTRKSATKAVGTVLMTLSSIESTTSITIANGSEIGTGGENIVRFRVVGNYTISGSSRRTYQAIAIANREELDYAGIDDQYAIEVNIEAIEAGANGNVASYTIVTRLSDVNNVINVEGTSGGTDKESDSSLRTRIALVFTGNNVGTEDGLRRVTLTVTEAKDALVVGPGNELMLRDGTQVENGVITSLGSGGMVDIWVLGEDRESFSEIFTFQGLGTDATDQLNDVVLGRYGLQYQEVLKQLQEELPKQPAIELTSVTGVYTEDGVTETVEYTIDTEVELKRDIEQPEMSGYENSVYGADKLHFKTIVKTLEEQRMVRGTKDGKDSLSHRDVDETTVYPTQKVSINNDTAIYVDANTVRTRLNPVYSVSRVYNFTTGEEYTVEEFTTDGSITIVGGDTVTIAMTDRIQVDYVYLLTFSRVTDFGILTSGLGVIDWSKSGKAIEEKILLPAVSIDERVYHLVDKEDSYVAGNWLIRTRQIRQIEDVSRVLNWSAQVINEELGRNPSIVGTSEFYLARSPISNLGGTGLGSVHDSSFSFGRTFQTYEEEEWSDTSYPSEPGKFMLNYTTGQVKLYVGATDDVVVADVTTTYKYREEYSLVDMQTNIDDTDLQVNQFRLSSVYNIGKPKPQEADCLEVYYTYSRYPSEELEIQPVLPTHLIVDIANGTNGSGKVVISGTAAWIIPLEQVIVTDPSFIVEVIGALDESDQQRSGFIGKVAWIKNVTQDILYDLTTYYLQNPIYDSNAHAPSESGYGYDGTVELAVDQFMLDSALNTMPSRNDILEIGYIWVVEGSSETIEYTVNAILLTSNLFWTVTNIAYDDFRDENVVPSIAVYSFNEPWSLVRSYQDNGGEDTVYYVTYGFISPKVGEEISIVYVYNGLTGTVQNLVNTQRIATQNVVVKSAKKIELDVYATIEIVSNYVEAVVIAEVESVVTSLLTADTLGGSLQPSDVTYVIASVAGVDSVELTVFARSEGMGVGNISMLENEYYAPGHVVITAGE